MKKSVNYLVAVLVVMAMSIQSVYAVGVGSRMESFFSYNNDQAYWWVSKLAHPTNNFQWGDCVSYGDYVDVTVHSVKHTLVIRLHKNGHRFDRLSVVSDTDWIDPFLATNACKDVVIDFWRNKDPDSVRNIESIFGSLNSLSGEDLCLATLTYLYWKYPY
ncbi:MAG: hypothetical protein IJ159_05740 [Prevotella sp.]|nr:hypothetical protein [Prevotella sp.]